MSGISDTTMRAAEYALDGLARRADVRSHNVANHNTPGFRAGAVDFESALRQALATGRTEGIAQPVTTAAPSLPGPHQNTVDLETELVGMIKDNLMRDAMVNTFNAKVDLLRTAIRG